MTATFPAPDPRTVEEDVTRALAEDIGTGDVSADLVPDSHGEAWVECREAAVIAGQAWFEATFQRLDPALRIDWRCAEGHRAEAGAVLCTMAGRTRAILSGERCGLNFLQLLSGTAEATAAYVAALGTSRARILDTRKTVPGLRVAQKYAVRVGGGMNHRMGLFDAVMIKENHVHAAGSIAAAVQAARGQHPGVAVIVEVEDFEELEAALAEAPERILLDDFSLHDLREAVRRVDGRVALEVSGGVGVEQVGALAATGVDFISVGALTKHVRAIDLSLRLGRPPGGQIA